MIMTKKVVLFITPQTHVRATRGDSVFFRIPREKLWPRGLERLKRLEKYNEYKVDLLTEAKKARFQLIFMELTINQSGKKYKKGTKVST